MGLSMKTVIFLRFTENSDFQGGGFTKYQYREWGLLKKEGLQAFQ